MTTVNTTQTRRRPTASKPIRQVARAAHLSLEKLAEAVVEGQPSPPTPSAYIALVDSLTQSTANANPEVSDDEMAGQVTARIEEMAEAGDDTAKAIMDAQLNEFVLTTARMIVALEGAPWVPEPPAIPKQQRMDSIAATVLELTGWTSVDSETVGAVYRWLFGDEAEFLAGTEMRVEAAQRMAVNPALHEVHVAHPDTGEPVLVTREEIHTRSATPTPPSSWSPGWTSASSPSASATPM